MSKRYTAKKIINISEHIPQFILVIFASKCRMKNHWALNKSYTSIEKEKNPRVLPSIVVAASAVWSLSATKRNKKSRKRDRTGRRIENTFRGPLIPKVSCLFQLYIILIRPERNVRQSMMPNRHSTTKSSAVTGTNASSMMAPITLTAITCDQNKTVQRHIATTMDCSTQSECEFSIYTRG